MEDRMTGKTGYLPPEGKRESRSHLLVPEEREVDMPLVLGPRWKALKGFTAIQRQNENMYEIILNSLMLWPCLPVYQFSMSPVTDEQGAERHLSTLS